jgi:hypothetical protein
MLSQQLQCSRCRLTCCCCCCRVPLSGSSFDGVLEIKCPYKASPLADSPYLPRRMDTYYMPQVWGFGLCACDTGLCNITKLPTHYLCSTEAPPPLRAVLVLKASMGQSLQHPANRLSKGR